MIEIRRLCVFFWREKFNLFWRGFLFLILFREICDIRWPEQKADVSCQFKWINNFIDTLTILIVTFVANKFINSAVKCKHMVVIYRSNVLFLSFSLCNQSTIQIYKTKSWSFHINSVRISRKIRLQFHDLTSFRVVAQGWVNFLRKSATEKLRNQCARAHEIATVPRVRRFPKTLNAGPRVPGRPGVPSFRYRRSRLVDSPSSSFLTWPRSWNASRVHSERGKRCSSRLFFEQRGEGGDTDGCTCVTAYCSTPARETGSEGRPRSFVRSVKFYIPSTLPNASSVVITVVSCFGLSNSCVYTEYCPPLLSLIPTVNVFDESLRRHGGRWQNGKPTIIGATNLNFYQE